MEIAHFDQTMPTLAENLALDEALLLEAEDGLGGELLRFWEWPKPAVVLGASGSIAADVEVERCESDGIAIQRRASGGGTVLLNQGCLLFSLILRFDRHPALKDVNASYRWILGRMSAALGSVAKVEMAGTSDLAIDRRKFSGNAQQRKRDHVLHHGTLLYAADLDLYSRYLRMPDKQPEYRERREHESFVTNLSTNAESLKQMLIREWGAGARVESIPTMRVQDLVVAKYATAEWVKRR